MFVKYAKKKTKKVNLKFEYTHTYIHTKKLLVLLVYLVYRKYEKGKCSK